MFQGSNPKLRLMFALAKRAFEGGDETGALLLSMFLSDTGHGVAHQNAAYLWKLRAESKDLDASSPRPGVNATCSPYGDEPDTDSILLECWQRPASYYARLSQKTPADYTTLSSSCPCREKTPCLHENGTCVGFYPEELTECSTLNNTSNSTFCPDVPSEYEPFNKPLTVADPEVCGFFYDRRAASAGVILSMHAVAESYQYGRNGAERNSSKSFEWLMRAAAAGDPKGTYYAARALQLGEGTDRNLDMAHELYWDLAKGNLMQWGNEYYRPQEWLPVIDGKQVQLGERLSEDFHDIDPKPFVPFAARVTGLYAFTDGTIRMLQRYFGYGDDSYDVNFNPLSFGIADIPWWIWLQVSFVTVTSAATIWAHRTINLEERYDYIRVQPTTNAQ